MFTGELAKLADHSADMSIVWCAHASNIVYSYTLLEANKASSEDLKLCSIKSNELDRILEPSSCWSSSEIATKAWPDKLEGVLQRIQVGHCLTPIRIEPFVNSKETERRPRQITIVNGRHRYSVSKFLGQGEIPVLVSSKHLDIIKGLVGFSFLNPSELICNSCLNSENV